MKLTPEQLAEIRKEWNTAERVRIKHDWVMNENHEIMESLLEHITALESGYDPLWAEKLQIARANKNAAVEENKGLMLAIRKYEALIKDFEKMPDEWIKLTDSDHVSPTEAQGVGTCIDQLKAKLKEYGYG